MTRVVIVQMVMFVISGNSVAITLLNMLHATQMNMHRTSVIW